MEYFINIIVLVHNFIVKKASYSGSVPAKTVKPFKVSMKWKFCSFPIVAYDREKRLLEQEKKM